jgi:hypothetical protein
MVASAILSVPKPKLAFDDAGGGAAAIEKPVTVSGEAVNLNGSPVGVEALGIFGLLAYRRLSSGASLELWDDGAKGWIADPGNTITEKQPIKLAPGQPTPAWQAIVVGAGGKDAAGAPQFAKAVSGYPKYSFRTIFGLKDNPTFRSEETDSIIFGSASDKNLVVMGAGDGEDLDKATLARLGLKNPSLQQIGIVLIERDGAGSKITITNASGANIVIRSDGGIELNPASGQVVKISSDIQVEKISYQPGAGGARQTL